MQDKFFVPMATMVAGVVVWVLFVILRMTLGRRTPWSSRVDVVACLAAGGLVTISGFSWLLLGGPAVGQVVRFAVLLGMAAFTYWKIRTAAAAVLTGAAAVLGVLALVAFL